jgi:cystathionine beta-lyase
MNSNFDQAFERRGTRSVKWDLFDPDVLPLWVADMDFPAPEPVIQALRQRVEHGIYGYTREPKELRQVIVERMAGHYNWQIQPEWIVFLPGVVVGFNLCCHAFASPHKGVLVQTPVYPPILEAHQVNRLRSDTNALLRQEDNRYTIDFDAFEKAIRPNTRLFILCNPHNPVGRVFLRDELAHLAEICLKHNLVICSDEIHCDLVFSGHHHIPIASLSPEIAKQTVTLMAPSKTYNIAGLDCAFAIIPDESLRRQYNSARQGLLGGVNLMGYTAALAAYRDGQPWLDEILNYLESNRDYLAKIMAERLPHLPLTSPEGTYLAWLDCRPANLPEAPAQQLLKQARVVFNDGAMFGPGGEGFVRINFGCPRVTLEQAIERISPVLAGH